MCDRHALRDEYGERLLAALCRDDRQRAATRFKRAGHPLGVALARAPDRPAALRHEADTRIRRSGDTRIALVEPGLVRVRVETRIRLFQMTSGYPWWLPWRHVAGGCASCGQDVTFVVWTRPARDRRAYSALCLACGRATSEYLRTKGGQLREAPVSGNEWSPACVAVARLRRAVFSPPLGWVGP